MKRLIGFLCIALLLTGCHSQTDQTPADDTNWNMEASSQILINTNSYMRNLLLTEDHMLAFIKARGERGDGSLIESLQNGKPEIMNDSPSSACSFTSPDKCSGFIYGMIAPAYYKGKLYWFSNDYDQDSDTYIVGITRSNLDGTDRELFYSLKETTYHYSSSVPYFMTFHKNKIYVVYDGEIYFGDIQSSSLKKASIEGLENVRGLYFEDNTMYVYAENYLDKDKEHLYVVLKGQLDMTQMEIISENKETFYIDNRLQFYYGDNCVMMRNMHTNEEQKLADGYCLYIFYDGNHYLLDSILGSENPYLMLLDANGNQIVKKDLTFEKDRHSPQIFVDNKLYVYIDGECGYYEIKDKQILDYQTYVIFENDRE